MAEVVLDDEVPPLARVKRSRLAFAVSATVAALPILVLDNLPATAATDGEQAVEVVAEDEGASSSTAADLSRSAVQVSATLTVEIDAEDVPLDEVTTTEVAETTTSEAPAVAETQPTESVAALRAPASSAPAPTVAPTTTVAPAPPTTEDPGYGYGDPADPATWDRLAQCEAHGNWALNTGNGYYGGLQFSLGSWQGVGGSGYPHEATREEQIRRGQILQSRYGWGQWPHCSAKLGYR